MNIYAHITDHRKLRPTRAIVIYEDNTTGLATVHNILNDGDKTPVLLPGRLLTREALGEMVRKISNMPQTRSVLPEGVLCFDSGRLVWWVPSRRAPIFFNTGDKAFNEAMLGKSVWHPPLVFMAEAGRLRVLALAQNERPKATTPLYRAPYFNLYAGDDAQGLMCAGNVKLPEAALPSEIAIWEKAFFETNFTHTNIHSGKLTLAPGGHNDLWRACIGADTFPLDTLVPIKGLTLEGLVNR